MLYFRKINPIYVVSQALMMIIHGYCVQWGSLQAQSLFLGCCPLCFSVSGPFVGRFDCWGQPFSSCPCQRDLWGMHLGQHCPNKCSYSIDEKLYSKTVLFICTATSKLAELVHVCILFYSGAYIKDEPCEEDKDRPISGPDVSCVSVIAP